ncbi:LOW QUALITY PROTEIN: uncharacterized protein LOC124284213 [Haliotis rubra]|uniref:LOW QUALITY PROTEIN: uncharacterized protein LOC124284213 n=1 Tax=Haliotis rubra TaxID=36100 RepID=UPI001EE58A66|nr:LOW QUALITY PROTEIN: uncharacterized protein LOC124284213 [Haliotis rubra]
MARRARDKKWLLKIEKLEYIDREDSGVHLEEPSSPLQQQWSTSDLDEFVRQLTNPKHHISKVSSASPMSPTSTSPSCATSPRQSSVDRPQTSDICTDFQAKCTVRRACVTRGKSDDVTTSQSRFKLGRLRRTRQRSSEGDSVETVEASNSSVGDDGIYDVSESIPLKSPPYHVEHHVTFTCDTSPDGSDTEHTTHKPQEEVTPCKKDSKRRRFRKMLTRPLRRSHSAGCAKDIPAHALFLQHQGDTEIESIESRRLKLVSSESTECETGRRPPRPIHKTSSADAAMMASDDIPSFSNQAKTKSRGLAKNMKKKLQFLRRRHTDTSLGDPPNRERQDLSHQPGGVQQWSKSFEALLTDRHGLELFKGFLKSEFSEENIEFWIACEQFKTTKSSKLSSVANKIYTDFVAVQAPREINLDSKTRVKTLGNLSQVTRQTFEDAQRRVQALMEKDSYPRFLQSELYQRLLVTPQKS